MWAAISKNKKFSQTFQQIFAGEQAQKKKIWCGIVTCGVKTINLRCFYRNHFDIFSGFFATGKVKHFLEFIEDSSY